MLRPARQPCACGRPKSQVAKTCWECRQNQVHSTCQICGERYSAKASRQQATCSESCAYEMRGRKSAATQSRKISIPCEWCDKPRLISPSYANRRFCSTTCGYAANSGPGNRNWQGGITSERAAFDTSKQWGAVRKRIWVRDDATCQKCAMRYDHSQRTFEVHHIIPFRYAEHRLSLTNLILLCVSCHKWVHSKRNTEGELIEIPD